MIDASPAPIGLGKRMEMESGRNDNKMRDEKYLKLLAKEYPTIQAASSEIVNLTAIC